MIDAFRGLFLIFIFVIAVFVAALFLLQVRLVFVVLRQKARHNGSDREPTKVTRVNRFRECKQQFGVRVLGLCFGEVLHALGTPKRYTLPKAPQNMRVCRAFRMVLQGVLAFRASGNPQPTRYGVVEGCPFGVE